MEVSRDMKDVHERRFGEKIYAAVDRKHLSQTRDAVAKAREYSKANFAEAYLVEAAMRRILDFSGGLLGYTAAILAAENGLSEILKLLLDNGANELAVDSVGTTMLHAAASAGQLACIDLLVKRVNVDEKDKRGDTALHWSCARGNMDVIKKLIEHGASINMKNNNAATAIYNACYNGHNTAVDFLIQRGASLSIQNAAGDTPLHVAISFNQLSIVDSLVKNGARTDIRNNEGKLAIEMTNNAAVREVMPVPSTGTEAGRAGGSSQSPKLTQWKPSFSLPTASLTSKKQIQELADKLRSTLVFHEGIERRTLLRSLQGSLDKLSWWKFELAYDDETGSDIERAKESFSRPVSPSDLPFLAAYLRFSSQCGVDMRPVNFEIRIEDDEHDPGCKIAYFLVPLHLSLLKPETGSRLLFVAGEESRTFAATTMPGNEASTTRSAAVEKLKAATVGVVDEFGDASLILMDLTAKSIEDSGMKPSVAIMKKRFSAKSGEWTSSMIAGEDIVPGFSSTGHALVLCRGTALNVELPEDELKEKGITVL